MPLYHYEATDRAGKAVIGSMQAGSEAVVTRRLASLGYTLTSLESGAGKEVVERERPGRVPALTRALFLRQLATATRAGIPLYLSLAEVARTVADPGMAAITREIAARVERGGRLSEALAAYPQLFTEGVVGLVAAAEVGGFLDRALEELADDAERQVRVRRELGRATRYCKIVLITALTLGLPLASFIGPMIRTVMATGDRGVAVAAGLKASLRTLLTVSLPLIAGVLGLGWALGRWFNRPAWTRLRDGWLLRLPVVGPVHGLHAQGSFLMTLARLAHAGIGPSRAWETAAGAVENRAARAQIERSLPMVEAGGRFSDALAAAGVCTPLEAGLVANGELAGQLEEALERVGQSRQEELEAALRRLPFTAHIAGYALAAPIVLYVVARFYQSYYASLFRGLDESFGS